MNRADIRVGISGGLLAATATSGALIVFGSRSATAARPFNVIASHLLGASRSAVYGFVPGVTITGVAVHVLLMVVAGLVVAGVSRRRFAPVWIAAVAVSILSALISIGIARRGGESLARLLPLGDLVMFHLIAVISLTIGIRLAFFERESG